MGDIDFEELDKAVSSLMGQAGVPAEPSVATTPVEAVPPSQPVEPVAPVLSAPSSDASSPIVSRRTTGRFMDVIPSSSRSAQPRPVPSAAASREAAPLQPPVAPEPVVASEPTFVDTPSPAPAPMLAEQPEVEPVDQFIETGAMTEPVADAAPLSSPFLEGVEIDKRPLGSAPTAAVEMSATVDTMTMPDPIEFGQENATAAGTLESDPWTGESEPDVASATLVAEEPLQPELSPEVLAVETMAVESVEPLASPTPEPSPAVETDVPSAQSEPVASEPAVPAPLTPGDIAPQYSAAPTDTPEPSAVFDAASEVPQPLNHPAKKKSGWSVVLWILLMVIVGAGGGVAVWYFLVK